jgi:cysteinyl-tRNA synthetase
MLDADFVLGLDLHRVWASPAAGEAWQPSATIRARVAERVAARAAGDFDRADGIRAELAAQGVSLTDRPDGTSDVQLAVDSR